MTRYSIYFHTIMDKKFITNVKMFLIGIVLLALSFSYIKGHPWERNSFVPSLQMLYYKGELFFYWLMGKDVRSLETKQQFTKIYNELSYLVESSHCTDETLIQRIKEQQEILKNIDYSVMNDEQYTAITTAQDLKKQIEEQCSLIKEIPTTWSNNEIPTTGNNQE